MVFYLGLAILKNIEFKTTIFLAFFSKTELRAWFERFDKDGDGFVNRNDVRDTMESLGSNILSPQLDELMRNDSSGKHEKLNFEDFCFAVARL